MPVLGAFVFPPIDELFRWKDLWFNGSPLAINKTVLLVLISSLMIVTIFILGSRKRALRPGGVQNVVEMTYEFIDNGITKDVVGHDAGRFTPFLGTLFLFILFLNFWEVIPGIQFPPTSRMGIPGFLALLVYAVYLVTGFKNQGFKYLTGHLFPPGVPKALYILVTPIEFVQLFLVRPFSLAVRLLANMMAGHILLTALALLTAYALDTNPGILKVIAVGPFLLNIGVTGFEILVAFLQAYIFTLLTAVYLGDALHPDH
ncbi:MAG: F0F1-type synthase, alpha subunit [Actinomycetia bacterium]|nr:F0F1-type synthase, alpha subunit [Actinomycetes bacterium]